MVSDSPLTVNGTGTVSTRAVPDVSASASEASGVAGELRHVVVAVVVAEGDEPFAAILGRAALNAHA
jgi:hypothetical protein